MEAVQTSVLARNLAALRKGSPDAAARIESAAPRTDARIITTDDGAWSVELGPQALASRRRPLDEARRFADTVDPRRAAIVVIGGFGAGHHVRAVAERLGRTGVVIVFEPDIPLLRAVLEHADCSAWFARHNVAILTDPDDGAAMAEVVRGLEGLAAMGVELAEHPPNRARLADALPLFHKRFIDLVRSLRMTVTTTLTQVPTTLANATQNIDHYALAEGALTGIDDLAGACAGRPALVISAGPGLAACLEALADPAVRDRCLIVAVQTVLRPLLRAGIRPHFVTALDYSEISARFYEGLTERDLHGITLVVEPKVNPAVTSAFSGRVRCTSDLNLDRLLGPELAAQRQRLEQGATVAHLAYYLARHCGCDPVGLIGQDLAFTDGAYYGPGASIHNLWACELNGFNTLELMEWLRIVRMAPHLRRATDVLNRPVFTDEQMDTYRLQFERDFRLDADRGLRVFDCGPAGSPGSGVRKQHAQPITLPDFLSRFAHAAAPHHREPIDAALARASSPAADRRTPTAPPPTRRRVLDRLAHVRRQVWRMGELSRRAESDLTQMLEHHADQVRVNRLIAEVEQMRAEVGTLEPGAFLVHTLNQAGSLERIRADRLLQIEIAEAERAAASGSGPPMDPFEAQRRTIERDIRNVRSLARSADEMNAMLRAAEESLSGAPKRTRRERAAANESDNARDSGERPAVRPGLRVEALVHLDTRRTALGLPRHDLVRPVWQSLPGPALCVRRLLATPGLDAVRILTDNASVARRALGEELTTNPNVLIEPLTDPELAALDGPGRRALIAARSAAPACWRGAPGGLTAFDEALDPAPMSRVMHERAIDAALVIHADAWLVCPDRCARLIERHRADPDSHRLVFSQDPPGLGAALLARSLMADIAALRATPIAHNQHTSAPLEGAGKFAGLSGALAYVPSAPAMDLIAQSLCVDTPPAIRDNPRRYLADTPSGCALLLTLIHRAGDSGLDPLSISAETITDLANTHAESLPSPVQLTLPVAEHDPAVHGSIRWASPDDVARALARVAQSGLDVLSVTLTGSAHGFSPRALDPLEHPARWPALLRAARHALPHAAIHLRTRLLASEPAVRALALDVDHRPDLLSVDLLAESADTYRAITTDDTFGLARRNIDTLLAAREQHRASAVPAHTHGAWWATPVIIARMVRCDAAYADVETFVNRWMTNADWAVLDPLPSSAPASLRGRIAPMPLPDHARARLEREHVSINPFAESDSAQAHRSAPAHVHLRADDPQRARPAGAAP
ncbi:MAG: DUF115 domain-containing protein [Phycisphaeraceae bacterium]|nr:DUF115 domain-containing protein [Phycisphaeraceae bacterium]